MITDSTISGRSIAFVVPSEAPSAERHVARVCTGAARHRGADVSVLQEGDATSVDLTVFLGTTFHRVISALDRFDRCVATSPATKGSQAGRVLTFAHDGAKCAAIWGADVEGLWIAAGRFMRSIVWGSGIFEFPRRDEEFRPAFELRGEVLSSHYTANTFFEWSPQQWFDYIDEMALWGMNLFITIPIHMADWHGINPWANPPEWQSDERRREWEQHWDTQCLVSARVREMGLRYGLWIPANDVPPMMAAPDWDRGGGKYVCPSVPDARKAIRHTREEVMRGLPHIDYWFVPSADNGGCPCPDCQPWVNTYLSLAEEQYRALACHHPSAKVILSNQSLTHPENLDLCERLAKPGFDWVAGVAYAPGSNELYIQARETEEYDWIDWHQYESEHHSLKTLARTLPATTKLFLYPDITHLTRSQYPVWDIDPLVAWTYHRDTAFFRPRGFADVFRRSAPYADGTFPYSEGVYDDLNQVTWLALSCDPQRNVDDVGAEYWRWHVGEAAAQSAVRATNALEESWKGDITANAEVDAALIETAVTVAHSPHASWRIDLLRMRALMDAWLRDRILAAGRAEADVIAMLKADASEGGIRKALVHIDDAIVQLPAGSEEITRLEQALRDAGPRTPVGRIRHVTGNLAWMVRTLELALTDPALCAECIADVVDYERGVHYVDCGNPARDVFRVHGRPYICLDSRSYQTPFDAPPDIRPSQNSLVMTCGDDDGIVYRFAGLDPTRRYAVRLTYFLPTLFTYRETRAQRLEASGVEVHGELTLPRSRPEQFQFPLPAASHGNGETTLRFLKAGGGMTTVVSEIWIREQG